MAKRGQRWRQLMVWLHVVVSVCWMGQALTLVSLLAVGVTDPGGAVAATTMARHLDITLLAPLANASALTGFLLAAMTSWGFLRYWWVAAKFSITLVQLYLGVFVLSSALDRTVAAARSGTHGPAGEVLVGGVLMAGAIGYQAWLSVSKPWGRIRPAGSPAKLPTAPSWLFAAGACAVCVDLAVAQLLGYPLPVAAPLVLVVALAVRRRSIRQQATGRVKPVDEPERVRTRRTALLIVVVLALQPLLWNQILRWTGDGTATAGRAFTVLHHLAGWLGAITIGAALVIAVSTWWARDGHRPATAMGTLTCTLCAVFAVTGVLMTALDPPASSVPLGLLLVGTVLLAPLAGIAAAGRRCPAR